MVSGDDIRRKLSEDLSGKLSVSSFQSGRCRISLYSDVDAAEAKSVETHIQYIFELIEAQLARHDFYIVYSKDENVLLKVYARILNHIVPLSMRKKPMDDAKDYLIKHGGIAQSVTHGSSDAGASVVLLIRGVQDTLAHEICHNTKDAVALNSRFGMLVNILQHPLAGKTDSLPLSKLRRAFGIFNDMTMYLANDRRMRNLFKPGVVGFLRQFCQPPDKVPTWGGERIYVDVNDATTSDFDTRRWIMGGLVAIVPPLAYGLRVRFRGCAEAKRKYLELAKALGAEKQFVELLDIMLNLRLDGARESYFRKQMYHCTQLLCQIYILTFAFCHKAAGEGLQILYKFWGGFTDEVIDTAARAAKAGKGEEYLHACRGLEALSKANQRITQEMYRRAMDSVA